MIIDLVMASKRSGSDGEYDFRDKIAAAMQRLVDECDGDQTRAGLKIGKSQGTVSEIVTKKRTLRIEGLVALRNALGISLDEMLGLEPQTQPAPALDQNAMRELARIAVEEALATRGTAAKDRPIPPPVEASRGLAESVGVRRIADAPKKRAKR